MVAEPEELTPMNEPSNDKIELLVRSVLAAVDARLVDIRTEIHAVATDVEQRHREVLSQIHDLENRWAVSAGDADQAGHGGDPLAARMEQATQVLLERIEAMHQRNTMATNERFALINHAIEQLNPGAIAPFAVAASMTTLDAVNAPLRVGPTTGPVPIATHVPTSAALPPVPPLAATTATAAHNGESEPIDLTRLADLLSERLDHISLPLHQN